MFKLSQNSEGTPEACGTQSLFAHHHTQQGWKVRLTRLPKPTYVTTVLQAEAR